MLLEKAQKNPKWLRHDCAPRKCKEGVAVHLLNHLLLLPRPPPAPRLAPPLQSGRPPSPSPTPFAAAPRLETHAAAPKCVAGSRRDASTGSAGVDADNPGRGLDSNVSASLLTLQQVSFELQRSLLPGLDSNVSAWSRLSAAAVHTAVSPGIKLGLIRTHGLDRAPRFSFSACPA